MLQFGKAKDVRLVQLVGPLQSMIMQIEKIGSNELNVTFTANPAAVLAQNWVKQLQDLLTGKEKKVLVDTSSLPMLSSLLIGVIMKLFRAVEAQGGTISVNVANNEVLKVFQVFQLTRLFEVKVVSS